MTISWEIMLDIFTTSGHLLLASTIIKYSWPRNAVQNSAWIRFQGPPGYTRKWELCFWGSFPLSWHDSQDLTSINIIIYEWPPYIISCNAFSLENALITEGLIMHLLSISNFSLTLLCRAKSSYCGIFIPFRMQSYTTDNISSVLILTTISLFQHYKL